MSHSSSTLLLFSPLLFLLFFTLTSSQETPIVKFCSSSNYTSPSPFSSTLFHLLNNLISAANTPSLYTTATSGNLTNPLFGIAQCRPDTTTLGCLNCINNAAYSSSTVCPFRRSAALYFNHCFLRYSQENFFGSINLMNWRAFTNSATASNPATFRERVSSLMWEVIVKAKISERSFAVAKGGDGDGGEQKVYAMAWCSMDLLSGICFECLKEGMRMLPLENIGGSLVAVTCSLRFEIYPFYDLKVLSLLPPPLPTTTEVQAGHAEPPDHPNNGKRTIKRRTVPLIG